MCFKSERSINLIKYLVYANEGIIIYQIIENKEKVKFGMDFADKYTETENFHKKFFHIFY